MKKQLQQISNNKTGKRIAPVLFTLSLMLASMMGLAQTAYITNDTDSTVSVINVATNAVTGTIKVGAYPEGISVSPDGSKVYALNNNYLGSGSVSVINTTTNTVSATINVGTRPHGLAVSPDGSKLYVANYDANTVSVINTATNTVSATITVGTYPTGVSVSSDGTKVYIGNSLDNTVSVINTATNTVSATITVGVLPLGICASPDGRKVYVVNDNDNTVSVINAATNTVSATIKVGYYPWGITVGSDGSKVYITNQADGTVNVINTLADTVSATITVGLAPLGVSVSPDGSKLYVANESNGGNGSISVINTATNIVTATIFVGHGPYAFGNFISTYPAITPCSSKFFIAADTTQLHHYLIRDISYGKQPIKYDWSWGDGSHDTIPYPIHTYADSGFYNICLSITDSAGCQSTFCDSSFHALRTTNTMVYMTVVNPLVTGTKEVSLQTPEVVLYPNPATNQLTIHTSAFHNEAVMVSVMNVMGQPFDFAQGALRTEAERSRSLTIDLSSLPAGMYFLQMKGESGSVVKKFVKE